MATASALSRIVLTAMFDDASLFPPAAAPMEAALGLHDASGRSPWGFARGRFLVPLGALPAVASERALLGLEDQPLELGVIVGSPADPTAGSPLAELARLADDLGRQDANISIAHVEYRPSDQTPDGVAVATGTLRELADDLGLVATHLEVASTDGPTMTTLVETVAAARERDARLHAKLRFGGLTPDLFPSDDVVLAFLSTCVTTEVPFKGTAGLHHAWFDGGDRPHHGYLAVLLTVIAFQQGREAEVARRLLHSTSALGMTLTDEGLDTPELRAAVDDLRSARRAFVAFGTCSFTEPLSAYVDLLAASD